MLGLGFGLGYKNKPNPNPNLVLCVKRSQINSTHNHSQYAVNKEKTHTIGAASVLVESLKITEFRTCGARIKRYGTH